MNENLPPRIRSWSEIAGLPETNRTMTAPVWLMAPYAQPDAEVEKGAFRAALEQAVARPGGIKLFAYKCGQVWLLDWSLYGIGAVALSLDAIREWLDAEIGKGAYTLETFEPQAAPTQEDKG